MRLTSIQQNAPQSEDRGTPTAVELVGELCALSRATQALLAAQARGSGLPLLEFLVLIRAADDDGVVARDAGRELRLNTSTMSGLSDRLEKDKLIRRYAHPEDRRLLLLRATPKGLKAVERALGPLLAQLIQLAQGLGDDQKVLVHTLLDEAVSAVVGQAKAARPRPTRRALARAAGTER